MTYGGVEVYIPPFLTSAIGEQLTSHPCHFTPRETASGIHYAGGQVGLRTSLDVIKKSLLPLPRIEP
jgi:hypothetical protein